MGNYWSSPNKKGGGPDDGTPDGGIDEEDEPHRKRARRITASDGDGDNDIDDNNNGNENDQKFVASTPGKDHNEAAEADDDGDENDRGGEGGEGKHGDPPGGVSSSPRFAAQGLQDGLPDGLQGSLPDADPHIPAQHGRANEGMEEKSEGNDSVRLPLCSYQCRVCGEVVAVQSTTTPSPQPPLTLNPRAMFPLVLDTKPQLTESLLRAVEQHCRDKHRGYYDWNLSERLLQSLSLNLLNTRIKSQTPAQTDQLVGQFLLYLAAQVVPHPDALPANPGGGTVAAAGATRELGTAYAAATLFEARFAIARCFCQFPRLLTTWFGVKLPHGIRAAFRRLATTPQILPRVRVQLERYRIVVLGVIAGHRPAVDHRDVQARLDAEQNVFLQPNYALWMSRTQTLPPPQYFRTPPAEIPVTATVAATGPPVAQSPSLPPADDVNHCRFCGGMLGYSGASVSVAQLHALHPEVMYTHPPPSLVEQIVLHERLLHPLWTSWNTASAMRQLAPPTLTSDDSLFYEALYYAAIAVEHVCEERYPDATLWRAVFEARFVAARFLVQSDESGWIHMSSTAETLAIGPPWRSVALEQLETYRVLVVPLMRDYYNAPHTTGSVPSHQERIDLLQSCFLCPAFIDHILRNGSLPARPIVLQGR